MKASGKLRGLSTGVQRSFQTDAQGTYSFAGLTYGRYLLEVSRSGFATQSVSIDVPSAAPVSRTVTMTLAASAFPDSRWSARRRWPGVDLAREEIAAPVQTANALDVQDSGALDLADFLNRRLNGVNVNEVQGNPFQPDVNYRGYTASPLLGTPQGLSVYMDGVRLNQPFGDVVSWDLIPRIAIAETTLMPGSNPLFGLNTLGGALSVETKDGRSHPGASLELSGGSFGRKTAEFEYGGSSAKGLSWYVAGNLFFEDGWRDDSPSDVRQFFGKLGWQGATTSLGLSLAYADNSLTGNGLQDQRFLARTMPASTPCPTSPRTARRSSISARGTAQATTLTFSGNVYFRDIRAEHDERRRSTTIRSTNRSTSRVPPSSAALTAAGYTGFPAERRQRRQHAVSRTGAASRKALG